MQRTKGRKDIKVKDVYDSKLRHSEIVASDEPLDEVIRKFAKRADLRGLFLTDNKGKLVGVVTRIDLVNLAKFKLGADLSIDALRKFLLASSVRDVIHPYSWKSGVTPEDSIIRALDIMIQHDLIDIPVIDKKGRILGDLKLSEVLLKAIS